jgi:hypothetical protein
MLDIPSVFSKVRSKDCCWFWIINAVHLEDAAAPREPPGASISIYQLPHRIISNGLQLMCGCRTTPSYIIYLQSNRVTGGQSDARLGPTPRVCLSPALKNQSGKLRNQTQLNGHPAGDFPHNPHIIQWGRCSIRFKCIIVGTLRRQRFSLLRLDVPWSVNDIS